jgi:hypothetical protein
MDPTLGSEVVFRSYDKSHRQPDEGFLLLPKVGTGDV